MSTPQLNPAKTVPPDKTLPEDLSAFIHTSVTSIWTLELLLVLKRSEPTGWSIEQLVRELRASCLLVLDIVGALQQSGLIVEEAAGIVRYGHASADVAGLVERLEQLAVRRPMAVRSAIVSAPHNKVQVFADAFKVKKE